MRGLYPGRIGILRCWFLWREENRKTWRKTLGARREPTTNSTHKWHRAGIEPRGALVGGERSHHCDIPAHHKNTYSQYKFFDNIVGQSIVQLTKGFCPSLS